jgi:hypothetical protein
MKLIHSRSILSLFLPLLLGMIFGLLILYFFQNKSSIDTNFNEFALGPENTTSIEFVNNIQVHCYDFNNVNKCIDGYQNSRPNEPVILWLGNSQLHTINQMEKNDYTAPYILHKYSANDSKYLITFSQPNANLQEHLILFEYLFQKLPIKTLILPVVFDDMRETGIRKSLTKALENNNVIEALNESRVGQSISLIAKKNESSSNEYSGLDGTLQKKVELLINNELKNKWKIWEKRDHFRGQFFANIYFFRNWLLGITPTSVRKKIPGRYANNLEAFAAILKSAKKKQVKVILYIPPLRDDVAIPYEVEEYQAFKEDIEKISKLSDIKMMNFESLVPFNYWGTKDSTSLNKEQELDFMHFKAGGHKLLADAIYSESISDI